MVFTVLRITVKVNVHWKTWKWRNWYCLGPIFRRLICMLSMDSEKTWWWDICWARLINFNLIFQILRLCNNSLTKVPQLEGFRKLEVLDLGGNRIQEVDWDLILSRDVSGGGGPTSWPPPPPEKQYFPLEGVENRENRVLTAPPPILLLQVASLDSL